MLYHFSPLKMIPLAYIFHPRLHCKYQTVTCNSSSSLSAHWPSVLASGSGCQDMPNYRFSDRVISI